MQDGTDSPHFLLFVARGGTWPAVSLAQFDICGCIGAPTLGDFDSANAATYTSSGATRSGSVVTIPLPADGTLVFSNFTVREIPNVTFITVVFAPNAANTPVTLLVTGNVTIAPSNALTVGGFTGTNGSAGVNGIGGQGGPGGFRGGDGAYQLVNFANNGGSGLGPGGGLGGTAAPLTDGSPGTFVGVTELLPLVGGAGGGGGASTNNTQGCSSGGGGGGGGALVIAANGTITVNGTIFADGGNGGFRGGPPSCSSQGHGGSAGAIRLVASTITGTGGLLARGGSNPQTGARAGSGAIRLEAFTNTLSGTSTDPVAARSPAPGPVTNPLTPTVEITTVNGQSVPEPPQGFRGIVDVILAAPGPVTVGLQTSGVPSGTGINVTVKPQVGGAPMMQSPTLAPGNCDASGICAATATFTLPSGAFFIEAQATFVAP